VINRSLRNRLAALFGLIVLGAIGIVYLMIVPQLEGRLRDQKLLGLAEAARVAVTPVRETVGRDVSQAAVRARVEVAANQSGARLTLLDVASGTEGQRLTISVDSQPTPDDGDSNFVLAEQAARSGKEVQGTEPTGRGRVAEVAIPLFDDDQIAKVAVFSDDLEAVSQNVTLIRRRVIIGGLVGLVLAVLAGYVVARALTARVRRLERAAHQVAAGDFSSRIVVDSEDELGRLASAFNDMQRQLAELHTAREQFIATASHELRTPVFSLGGFLELLEEEDLDEETQRAFMAQIRGQVQRLRKLTVELLDLSRIGSGALQLRYETTDVGQLARDVAAEFTPRAAELDVALPESSIEMECDPERVAQVLRILMDNAVVHTAPGTPIRVSAARVNGTVQLAVTDSGQGIKRKVMPHIFEPFFTSDDTQGAGLGLAIAHELAERMNGSLEATSRTGRTTFTLVLPT
jgi:signal transduction histidine kinase